MSCRVIGIVVDGFAILNFIFGLFFQIVELACAYNVRRVPELLNDIRFFSCVFDNSKNAASGINNYAMHFTSSIPMSAAAVAVAILHRRPDARKYVRWNRDEPDVLACPA